MRPLLLLLSSVLALVLSACGASAPSDGGSSGGGGVQGNRLTVVVDGDTVSPAGVRIRLARGTPLLIRVRSDRDGTLHVHSSPAQTLDYHSGTTNLRLTIDRPGVVDIEDHRAKTLIAQLELS